MVGLLSVVPTCLDGMILRTPVVNLPATLNGAVIRPGTQWLIRWLWQLTQVGSSVLSPLWNLGMFPCSSAERNGILTLGISTNVGPLLNVVMWWVELVPRVPSLVTALVTVHRRLVRPQPMTLRNLLDVPVMDLMHLPMRVLLILNRPGCRVFTWQPE